MDSEKIVIKKNAEGKLTQNKLSDVADHFSSINEKKTYELVSTTMQHRRYEKEKKAAIFEDYKGTKKLQVEFEQDVKNLALLKRNSKIEGLLIKRGILY